VKLVAKDVSKDSALGLFAAELRHARTARGLTQDALADKIAYSPSLVAMIETGRRIPTLDVAQRCDQALETSGVLTRLHRLVAAEAYPSWFRPFVELEKAATSLRSWQPMIVDGLLQTAEYARAVLRAARPYDRDEAIDALVAARMDRQEILLRDDPPKIWVVLDEAVLTRPIGEPGVMAAQLDRLITAARDPWITIQIMPTAAGAHPGLLGPLVIAGFDTSPDIAYLDTALTGQVVERSEDVRQVASLYDSIRAEALSPRASAELITHVVRTIWT
jgi:transcriptional regulator with XRE-family HTH domain